MIYKYVIRILKIGVVVIFFVHLLTNIYTYREKYTTKFDAQYWENRYYRSQWVFVSPCGGIKDPHINPKTCIWDDDWHSEHGNKEGIEKYQQISIGDDGLYTYVGWNYITGGDPTSINAEIPPLGKYLIGLSILVFSE